MFFSSNVIKFDQEMIANCFYHSCLALTASSKVDLSEFSEFERHNHSLMSRLIKNIEIKSLTSRRVDNFRNLQQV